MRAQMHGWRKGRVRNCMGGEKDVCANAWVVKRMRVQMHGRGKGRVRNCMEGEKDACANARVVNG